MRLIVEKKQGNKKGREKLQEGGSEEEGWVESRIRHQKRGRQRQRLVLGAANQLPIWPEIISLLIRLERQNARDHNSIPVLGFPPDQNHPASHLLPTAIPVFLATAAHSLLSFLKCEQQGAHP